MKYITIGLVLSLLVTSVWAGTQVYNFDIDGRNLDDGNLGDWKRTTWGDQTTPWFTRDGVLVSFSEDVCDQQSSPIIGDNTWLDYEVEVQFKIAKTLSADEQPCHAALGVAIRNDGISIDNIVNIAVGSTNNAAVGGADWDRIDCEELAQGEYAHHDSPSALIGQGVWHALRIIADGDHYQIFINDEPLCDFQGGALNTGGVLLYTQNAEVHFDNFRITGDTIPDAHPEPKREPGYPSVFFTALSKGLNMISLPLKPIAPHTARSFAGELGATIVIQLDEKTQGFVGFTPDAPDDGFAIRGGKGYIVNTLEDRQMAFVGTAWTNLPPGLEAPPLLSIRSPNRAWAFVVSGRLEQSQLDTGGYLVTVRNTRTNAVAANVVRSGYFAAAFADLSRQSVVEVGDRLEVVLRDRTGEIASEPIEIAITPETLRQAFLPVAIEGVGKPNHSLLMQNYPNPFNPETWMPYQLQDAAQVTIHIYNAQGGLVGTLDLGQRAAGFYRDRTRAAYWDGRNNAGEPVASGIYFYQLHAGDYSAVRRMVILK